MRQKFQVFLNLSVLFSLILSNISGGPGVSTVRARSYEADSHQSGNSTSTWDDIFSGIKDLPNQISDLIFKPKTPIPTTTPTFTNTLTVSPTQNPVGTPTLPLNTCNLYPIALSEQLLINHEIGDEIEDIYNGTQPGNFGWLTWAGSPSVPTLVASLTPPGDSNTYINPYNNSDHEISLGDFVQGKPGVSNSSAVRDALDQLKTIDIDIPVWDTSTGSGNNTQYHIVNFVRVRLLDYQLPGENRISAQFLGYSCGSGTPTSIPTPTFTDIPTSTSTSIATDTPTQTLTPIDTSTTTITPTLTASTTPTMTNTFTPTQTDTSTPSFTPTYTHTPTPSFTPTFTPTNTFTPTATVTPSRTLTATLPNSVNCFNWQDGNLQGWIQSPWVNPNVQILADSQGMHGFASNSGSYEAGVYFAMPAGSHKVLLSGQRLSDITVTQGPDAPTSSTPLSNVIQRGVTGSYFVTEAYVEIRWTVNASINLNTTPIFESFCYATFTPTATKTASATKTLTPTLTATPTATTVPTTIFFGPSAYLSFGDSPFKDINLPSFYLEDFEDHEFDTPGVTASSGGVVSIVYGPDIHDSIDADDGNIDGSGLAGDNFFTWAGGDGVTFSFDENVLGELPTHAGIVWTDGSGLFTFEAFDANGVSLGTVGPVDIADGTFAGTTADDHFFGVIHQDGISAIKIYGGSGGIELDHLQYGSDFLPPTATPTVQAPIAAGVLPSHLNNGPALVVTENLVIGNQYRIVIDGIVHYNGSIVGDPQWNDYQAASGCYCQYGPAVFFNDVPLAAQNGQTVYDLNHTYTFLWSANSTELEMYIGDSLYSDNSGEFNYQIFLDSVVPTPTPTPVPSNFALRFQPTVLSHGILMPPATSLDFGSDMTIEFWIRSNTSTAGGEPWHNAEWILDKDISGGGNPDWAVVLNSGRIAFNNGNPGGCCGDQTLYSLNTVNNGEWHHIAIVRDVSVENGLTKIFIDGVEDTSDSMSVANLSNTTGLNIGGEEGIYPSSARSFHGDLDDLRFWDIARTASDIQQDMNTRLQGDENGLVGYWNFDEGQGQLVHDQTQYAINGQLGSSIDPDDGDPLWILASELFVGVTATPTSMVNTPTPSRTPTSTPTVTNTPTLLPSPTPTLPAFTALTIPGWIASPANESTITSVVPITLASGITLTNGTIDYWPADDTTQVQILAENLSGSAGDTLATFDPTVLPNGSYIIRLSGTDSNGVYQESGILVTVAGEYKPGRVRFTITDLTVPVTGLPIVVGRTYDSLERNLVGDFGNGWSLAIGNPRLEVDQAHNVTMTMPNGERTTFHFTPTSYSGYFGFFMYPTYTPEAGEYGSMTVPDCLVIVSGGKYYCFLESGEYAPATYTYTDPYGRKFLMDADGTLKSITDLNANVLTFSADGITSSAGDLNVPFVRDSLGRITQITDPEGGVYEYVYDADGNLLEAQQPDIASPLIYHYDASHFFLNAVDPRGNTLIIDTYDPDGRLQSETDAQGNTWSYTYDVNTHTTTTTNPDNGTVVSVYNDFGKLLSQTDPLGRVTTFTYDANHNLLTQTNDMGHVTTFTYDSKGHPNSIKNGLNQTLGTITYNQYGGPTTINDGLGRSTTVSYDAQFMPVGVSDSLGSLGGYTWDAHGNPLTRSNGAGEATGFGYDAYGNLTSNTDPLNHSNTYTYDSLGRVLTSADPLGHTTTYTYDALGHVLSVTDDDQHTTSYTYDNNGNLTHVTDPLLQTTVYTYDVANRVSDIAYPDNTTAHFTYDFRGNVLTKTDALLHVTAYDYDEAGQLTDVTYASGTADEIAVRYEYDDAGRKIREFDALGHKTEYSYDAAGRLITVTDALNNSSTNSYDLLGQLLSTTDGEGHTTSYEYDVRGRLIRTTYADLTTSETTYDDAGRLLTSEDQAGRVTRYAYDDAGRMLNVTTAYGTALAATTQYSYDNAGRMLTLTDALGHPTSYGYDDLGRVTSVTDPLTHSSTSAYNAIGQLISSTDANNHTTQYEYDAMGRQTKTIFDDLSTIRQSYDANGQVLTSTDQNNKTTHYGYDALGRLISVTNPMTQTVSYTYDAVGNPLTITDANLHTTAFAYDVLNRQIQKTWADQTSFEAFTYNAVGNQLTHRMADGDTNTFTYDVMNRLETASYADGNNIAFTYTDAGQPETVVDARGTSGYAYDAQGRLSNIVQPGGGMVAYTYDLTGNRLTMAASTGTIHYEYDAASQLIQVTDPNNQTTTFAYDDLGLRTEKALPNGVTTTYGYDALNRLTDLTQQNGSTTLASYTYTLDAVGNRLSVTEQDGSSIHWDYDDAYRLLSETRQNSSNAIVGAASFTYDPAGNRLSQNINGSVTNYTYNELDQMLTAGSIQYGYDERGNMISATSGGGTAEYGYDSQNRQISVSLPNGTEITNTYDVGGHRVKQVVDSVATNYLWDEASAYGDVIRELSPGNMTSYVLAGSELLSQTHNGTTSYYLQDGQNSTRELTNPAGNITDTYDYSAFGELQNQTGSTVNHYLYTSQQYDESTELYSLRARYYSPSAGRFLSQDTYPVNFNNPLELNRYGYTANNPINGSDPSGYASTKEYVGIIGTVSLAEALFGYPVAPIIWYVAGFNATRGVIIAIIGANLLALTVLESLIDVGISIDLGRVPVTVTTPRSQPSQTPGTPPVDVTETPKSESNVIVELGSGDFSNLIRIKKQYPYAEVIGYEESLDTFKRLYADNYVKAISLGIKIFSTDYGHGIVQADIIIAIAPPPGSEQDVVNAVMSGTKPQGTLVYIATGRTETTGEDIRTRFIQRGVLVPPLTALPSLYPSLYLGLGEHPFADVLTFMANQ